MVQIKFTASGANTLIGGFASGDTLRCGEALAKHLVEEMKCAKYMDAPAPAAPVVQGGGAASPPVSKKRSLKERVIGAITGHQDA